MHYWIEQAKLEAKASTKLELLSERWDGVEVVKFVLKEDYLTVSLGVSTCSLIHCNYGALS